MAIKKRADGKFDKGNQSGTQFTSEMLRGNQYAKGNPPNRTSFDGSHAMEKHPCWKGGIQKHKDAIYITYAPNKRMRRARWVWIQVYGELPEGHVLYHKDGDPFNDDIENLEAITRAELIQINRGLV